MVIIANIWATAIFDIEKLTTILVILTVILALSNKNNRLYKFDGERSYLSKKGNFGV